MECIRQRSEQESGNGKELLVKMMEVFVLKFKTVSKLHLPVLLAKHRPPPPPPSLSSSSAVLQHAPLTPGPPSLAPMPSPATPGNPQTPATPATPDIKSEADVKPVPSPGPTSSLSQVDMRVLSGVLMYITYIVQKNVIQDVTEGEKKMKFGFPPSQSANYSVGDCRALVKTLVCGAKTITWGLAK